MPHNKIEQVSWSLRTDKTQERTEFRYNFPLNLIIFKKLNSSENATRVEWFEFATRTCSLANQLWRS